METAVRRLSQPRARRLSSKRATIAGAAAEVNRGIFFSAAIVIAGFVPLFTAGGIERHIFGPLAKTHADAIARGRAMRQTVKYRLRISCSSARNCAGEAP